MVSESLSNGTPALFVHPAPAQMAIIAWKSPLDGTISVSGSVSDNDSHCGDGVLWYIDQNSSNLAAGWFGNGGSQTFANGTGGSRLSSLAVHMGDMLYFAVNPNQNYYCDSTRLNISIQALSQPVTPTATPTGGYNLAQGKLASQSSDYVNNCNPVAGLAVDGNTNGNYNACSLSVTNSEAQPWWQVDLGAVSSISNIEIWNRTDCCSNRLSNFYVFVSDVPFQSTNLSTALTQVGVSHYYTSGQAGTQTTITVNRSGRYVRIQLTGTDYLQLAEVKVMGGTLLTPTSLGPTPTSMPTMTPRASATATPIWTPPAPSGPVIIDYVYDPLNRLTQANYSTGDYYHYTYDQVGNRLTQDQLAGSHHTTDTYVYDTANRILSKNGVNFTWDNNGNLLSDGNYTYTYDPANRLVGYSGQSLNAAFGYNGFGDRLQQTINSQAINYTLDINTGLPNVLADNNRIYTYGIGNLSQANATGTDYFLGDALGSTRQLVNGSSEVGLAESYDPFGNPADMVGSDSSIIGYTGQQSDPSGLIYLRARYYDPLAGRFLTHDSFPGYSDLPQTQNPYVYGLNNPILYTDPSGYSSVPGGFPFGGSFNSARQFLQGLGGGPCTSWDQLLMAGGAWAIAQMMDARAQLTAWVGERYQLGWENFGSALEVVQNPNAPPLAKIYAWTYIAGWGGFHLGLAIGGGYLAYVGASAVIAAAGPSVAGYITAHAWASGLVTGLGLAGTAGEAILVVRALLGDQNAQMALATGYMITGQSALINAPQTWSTINSSMQQADQYAMKYQQGGQAVLEKILSWPFPAIQVIAGAAGLVNAGNAGLELGSYAMMSGNQSRGFRPKSPNQLNQEIRLGRAPKGITSVHTPKVPNEKIHVHFDDGTALNIDGTWKHDLDNRVHIFTRAQKEWLLENGWKLP